MHLRPTSEKTKAGTGVKSTKVKTQLEPNYFHYYQNTATKNVHKNKLN